MTHCKICNSRSLKILELEILQKYQVSYHKCSSCEFIQTDEPFWLSEAYSSAITSLDIGLIRRNIICAPIVSSVINFWFDKKNKFIDYGGGYGMFVRMMRDNGFDYYRQDIYCENIFAKNFDVTCLKMSDQKFELLTAFEVFEHLLNPIKELEIMLSYSENIFFSTVTYDRETDLNKWWYLIPETGQHIAIYSTNTLNYMAKKFGLNYYNKNNFHLFTKKRIPKIALKVVFNPRFQSIYNRLNRNSTLLISDYNSISLRPIQD